MTSLLLATVFVICSHMHYPSQLMPIHPGRSYLTFQ
jgi:hypothetical protein